MWKELGVTGFGGPADLEPERLASLKGSEKMPLRPTTLPRRMLLPHASALGERYSPRKTIRSSEACRKAPDMRNKHLKNLRGKRICGVS